VLIDEGKWNCLQFADYRMGNKSVALSVLIDDFPRLISYGTFCLSESIGSFLQIMEHA
jgi:hypothetical protein